MKNILNMDLLKGSQIDIMSTLYLSGKTLAQVGEQVGRSRTCVGRILKGDGTLIRPLPGRTRIYSCNYRFFEIIDNGDKSYWVGFLAADGCIHYGSSKVSLGLAVKDREHVEKLRQVLNSNHPVRPKMGSNSYLLVISSKKMQTDLINKGVVPRKSLILKPPRNIPDYLIPHWVRGYFDGDGSIHFSRGIICRKRISITSTQEVLEFIQGLLGIGHIYKRHNNKAFMLHISVQADIRKFADYIYKDANTFLKRKWKRFQV